MNFSVTRVQEYMTAWVNNWSERVTPEYISAYYYESREKKKGVYKMPIDLFDTVRIIKKGIVGDVVEIVNGKDEKQYYLVQSDEETSDDKDVLIPGSCPIYECLVDEIERVCE